MNLFTSAGVELPAHGRRPRAFSKTLHSPLFNHRVVDDASRRGATAFAPSPAQEAIAADYARKARDPKFLKEKETAIRHRLIEEVLQGLLGYAPVDPGNPYSLALEYSIRAGSVDVALGRFNRLEGGDEVLAPFELKGPDTFDLDRIMPGRGRSAVQQAWDYAIDAPGSRWVLVSNCLEIRLYAFGRGRDAYERFDLAKLDERREHERLWRILAAPNLLGGHTDQLLRDTDSAYREITGKLYADYRDLREKLIAFLRNTSDGGPALPLLKAIEVAQKLLDRILFIAFAQRTDLMADQLLKKAAETINNFAPQPLWNNFLGLFRAVDQGSSRLDIPPYNGGLFAHDPVADAILVPDYLAQEIARLGEWDYRREVPVTVLGRLFEQSISDIEALKTGQPPAVSKRKREGVVYTPDNITRFLVEQTIGKSLEERRDALWTQHGMWEASEGAEGPSAERAAPFWNAYLAALRDFTILDPACGSGAFLVAAFDEMARRYRDAVKALEALEVEVEFDVFDVIVTENLYGVDLNPESVEITRLALWLKTARRDHRLQNLEKTVRDGDSVVADPAFTPRPFDWETAFPEVRARGGFDVVIGNPPYVRMEFLKAIKPYLAKHYIVADDRTDLYAYFFEQGVRRLKDGGRLGYISSSTFFRTGSGEKLRVFLGDGLGIETIVDFGDAQLFEGVTTYPAILTLKKGETGDGGDLRFLTLSGPAPDDLGLAFREARTMPRARLGAGSWQLENGALAALREKIVTGRKTLGEVYGAPLRGIVTGLNEAFVIDRRTHDALVATDPKSAEILKPFLRGENIKRWRVESEDLFLINTPKGKVDIEAYPAVRAHLAPFKEALEKRATQQEWWELQQAQLAYHERLGQAKIAWPHFQFQRAFTLDETGAFLNNKCFFLPTDDPSLLCLLNSSAVWLQLVSSARIKRGGYIEAEAQYVEALVLPDLSPASNDRFVAMARQATEAAAGRRDIDKSVRRRILDLAPPARRKLNTKLQAWHELDFAAFRAEVKKAFGADIPLKERGEWEAYLAENGAQVRRLSAQIAAAERDIDAMVYALFDLTPDEIALLEAAVAGAR